MATGLFNLKQVNQAISQGAWSGYIAPRWVEYLSVAGGGGGGSGYGGGGGGAGGLLTGIVTVAAGASYSVTVGGGGAGGALYSQGTNGDNSVFGSISSTGGGGGGTYASPLTGKNGGSGGGGAGSTSAPGGVGGSGVVNQGQNGGQASGSGYYNGGGGGGAGTVGLPAVSTTVAGNGGAGIASAVSGTVIVYAGGGGAGRGYNGTGTSSGGVGGGGAGGTTAGGVVGSANTGGGGGGYGAADGVGSAGGSGIVVVRYPGNVQFYTGGTVNYNNGYIIHIFTSNGTLAPTTPAPYNTSYQISRSLRFNSADSAYLDRAQTTGNTQKATWSGWVKRSALTIGAFSTLFSAGTSNTDTLAWNNTGDTLRFFLNGASSADLVTTQVFRDPSAWYHIVVAIDTTQATAANRILMYINGVQVTAFTTATYPTQNYTFTRLNTSGYSANLGSIGTGSFLSAYMTEVNFVDGQQLAATSFGATSTTTGIWSPIQYTGTYGTNGFYVNFSDNSNTTAATLGKDYSGNGNNWTPNNFSVTAGVGNDSMVDNPTQYGFDTGVGGSVRGNYCTLNPLIYRYGYPTITTFSNGNLDALMTSAAVGSYIFGSIFVSSGKWYWETTINAIGNVGGGTGIDNGNKAYDLSTGSYYYYSNGSKASSGSLIAYGASYTTGDIIGTAYDADAGTLTFYKNGTSQGVAYTGITGQNCYLGIGENGFSISTNFGQRAFAYTAPSGFQALCTQNLTTPTIGATSNNLATQFFAPVLYTGNGSTQSITDVGFQPDFTWIKCRSAAEWHSLFDSVRGVLKDIRSNSTNAEITATATLTAFNSNGFSLGADPDGYGTNTSGRTYVAWNWRAGNNAGASNSAGSITSTVSASTTSGFSIVTYTGTGANATVGHGLGVAPSMVIVKSRTNAYDWLVYNSNIGNTKKLYLNYTDAEIVDSTVWNNTSPTSSVFSLGSNAGVNQSTATYVAYCFAPIAGYSAFGSYTGNGSADGPFIYTGFRPAYLMFKRTDSTSGWTIYDASRDPYNYARNRLYANSADAESSGANYTDLLSNGFKVRDTDIWGNANGGTYIYMAFASNPFKYSLAR